MRHDGKVNSQFSPRTKPDNKELVAEIEAALGSRQQGLWVERGTLKQFGSEFT